MSDNDIGAFLNRDREHPDARLTPKLTVNEQKGSAHWSSGEMLGNRVLLGARTPQTIGRRSDRLGSLPSIYRWSV